MNFICCLSCSGLSRGGLDVSNANASVGVEQVLDTPSFITF